MDDNNVFRYIKVNHQGVTQSRSKTDNAPQKLLIINENPVYRVPTISKLKALFNNYNMNAKIGEKFTPIEQKEVNDFVDAVLATPAMNYAMAFLQGMGKVSSNPRERRNYFKSMWFDTYARDKRSDGKGSSGFEHVFLTELKRGKLIGLHNWVYFYEAEKKGQLDYKGYMTKLPLGNVRKISMQDDSGNCD